MASDPIHCVEFENAGKYLGEAWVFRGVDVNIPAAQVTAIIGASGSGKTTLLRLINGLYRPDEGDVRVLGENIPNKSPHLFRRKIGYAVQGAGLFPHMTIESNITKLAKLGDWSSDRIRARLDDLLDLTGLDADMKGRYPHELSGGQQHRVSLCRALMLEPKLLLLDEPFSAIDAITRNEIQDAFIELQRKLAFSAVLVTHDYREATKLAHYLLVLGDHGIEQHGALHDVIERPTSLFLRELVETEAVA
ncbi:MAG: ATP-binding cassette domain-containing protein [Gammaproteobacteria bacterium]|nr:ATP-binding cassette domain-containing protein [Gammaproteobacteria bacterium]